MKAYIVEKSALEHNIGLLIKKAGGKPIWGVVKGNGYGLGCVELARMMAPCTLVRDTTGSVPANSVISR